MKKEEMVKYGLLAAATAAFVTTPAWSESFNIDLDVPDATGGGLPADSYGAAAGQSGPWNAIDNTTGPFPLVDLNNQATGVTISTDSPPAFTVGSTGNLSGATSDDIALLGDVAYPEGSDLGVSIYTIDGLQDGPYDVYTYAMAPDVDHLVSEVTVDGADPQQVGGKFGGSLELGVTHSVHTTEVTDGTITITIAAYNTSDDTNDFASIAGFQIVQIPAPAVLPMFGFGMLCCRRRRRA